MKLRARKLSYGVLCAAVLLLGLAVTFRNHSLFAQAPAAVSSVHFTNITDAAGIKFVHFKGNSGISINREEFGPGVCVGDFDGDGWQDIYFVNGRDLYDRGISVRNALYHNNRDGTFTDVTEIAPVSLEPATVWGVSGATMTMTDSQIFLLRSTAGTSSTTIMVTAHLATSQIKLGLPAWNRELFTVAQLFLTMMVTAI